MSEKPITNPSIPYVGPLQGNLAPGKFVRILGSASPVGKGFSCNLQSGLSSYDDIVLQVLVRVEEGTIILNSQQHGGWGEALTLSNLQINRGQQFEILVICEPTVFKIGINGQHLCEFPHKVPYYKATYIKIEGDLSVSHISVENQPQAPPMDKPNSPPPPYPAPMLQSVYSQPPYPPPGTQPTAQPPYPPVGFQQNLPSQSPYPVSGPQSITAPPPYAVPGHQQTVPSQTPVPLNSAPQTIIYPSGGYATTPMIQHQSNTAALNATPREYPFWNRSKASAPTVLVPPEPSNSDVAGLVNPLTGEIETVEQPKNISKLSAAPSSPRTSTIPSSESSRQSSKACAKEMSIYEEEMLKLHKKLIEARMINEKMIAKKEIDILDLKKKAEEIRIKILEKDLSKKCNCNIGLERN